MREEVYELSNVGWYVLIHYHIVVLYFFLIDEYRVDILLSSCVWVMYGKAWVHNNLFLRFYFSSCFCFTSQCIYAKTNHICKIKCIAIVPNHHVDILIIIYKMIAAKVQPQRELKIKTTWNDKNKRKWRYWPVQNDFCSLFRYCVYHYWS